MSVRSVIVGLRQNILTKVSSEPSVNGKSCEPATPRCGIDLFYRQHYLFLANIGIETSNIFHVTVSTNARINNITVADEIHLNIETEGELQQHIWLKKGKIYIAQYPVCWTAQSALHFAPLADPFIPTSTRLIWKHSSHAAITRQY